MVFECFQVADSIFGKLWTNHLSNVMPFFSIGGKDTDAQELPTLVSEGGAFAKVVKFC